MESSWNPALRPDSKKDHSRHYTSEVDQNPFMRKDATSILKVAARPPHPDSAQDSISTPSLHGGGQEAVFSPSRNSTDDDSHLGQDNPILAEEIASLGHAHAEGANETAASILYGLNDREVNNRKIFDNAESALFQTGEVIAESSTNESFGMLEDLKKTAKKSLTQDDIKNAFEDDLQNTKQPAQNNLDKTSFFEILPLSQSTLVPSHSLPRSQAENFLEGDEDLDGHQTGMPALSFAEVAVSGSGTSNASSLGGKNEDFFAHNAQDQHQISSQSTIYDSEQARFEEGLPLVANCEPETAQPSVETLRNEITTMNVEDDDIDFFNQSISMDDESSAFRPQPLDRKSTSQVLASIQYAPHEINHQPPTEDQGLPSSEYFTGGEGAAASTKIVGSQIMAEEVAIEASRGIGNEDLSEVWKAALGDDELLEEKNLSLDPSTFFDDDGEGFLEDEVPAVDQEEPQPATAVSTALQSTYSSEGKLQGFTDSASGASRSRSSYVPTDAPSQQSGLRSSFESPPPFVPSKSNNIGSVSNGFANAQQPNVPRATLSAPLRPQMQKTAQSFVDKSKGGYTSPYDLPIDVTKPKRRPAHPTVPINLRNQDSTSRPPPPRTSSMYPGAPPSDATESFTSNIPISKAANSTKSLPSSGLKSTPSAGSFFEELPSAKSRPSSSLGRTSAPVAQLTPPLLSASRGIDPKRSSSEKQSNANSHSNINDYQLLPPERMSLFSDDTSQQSARQAVPVINSRYSPAPLQSSTLPPSNRYASSPAAPRPPSTHTLPYQPRTSSPLTQHSTASQQQQAPSSSSSSHITHPTSIPQDRNSNNAFSPRFPSLEPQHLGFHGDQQLYPVDANTQSHYSQQPGDRSFPSYPTQTPSADSTPLAASRSIYTPAVDRSTSDDNTSLRDSYADETSEFVKSPPQRSQTQSPTIQRQGLNHVSQISLPPYQRPASVNNYAPSSSLREDPTITAPVQRPVNPNSQPFNFIKPVDGRELDALERWKGCPVVSFGFGGTIVKMFPQHIPRYASGQKAPLVKCSAGEVKIENSGAYALDESIATFPGPLRARSKKKEVLDWLQKKLNDMENIEIGAADVGRTLPDSQRRHWERILLWKIVKIFVEYDGVVHGNETSEKAFRTVLSPETVLDDVALMPGTDSRAQHVGITPQEGSSTIPDAVRPGVLEELRKKLLFGNREQAVWHAVDNRLWAHAMLLSSTLDKSIWKQVSQEFVRQEVKMLGKNTESLAALYQVFAGNWEESTDELVPPSARAGLQMVSKSAGPGPAKNALDGLDRWQETLTLVLSNRTSNDGKALLALGQLLASYGRVEAAHICYIFAKAPGLFGGPDDPQVSVALLGADHIRRPFDYSRDFDSILLTEIYDFACTTLMSSSASTVSPHLQSYKLYHALILAEYGQKVDAQQYCDNIFATLKSTTKLSPYYHGLLVGALESLQDRLKQAPRDNSGSWISKPSIDKVSGSIWAKFNSYVAGDEDDAASTASGRISDAAAGPFARLTGDSPTLSRAPSTSDLFNIYSTSTSHPLASTTPAGNSRYAPASYTPQPSLDAQKHLAQDGPKAPSGEVSRPTLAPQQYSSRPVSAAGSSSESYISPPQPLTSSSRTQRYLPTPPAQPDYGDENTAVEETESVPYQQYKPTPPPELSIDQGQHQGIPGIQPMSATHNLPTSSYQSATSHEASFSSQGPPIPTHESHLLDESGLGSYHPPLSNRNPTEQGETPFSYEPPTSSYEPPTSIGYEPPLYTAPSHGTDDRQADVSPSEAKPKRSMMNLDDDDDFEARAAALRKEEKARKDREADEAFLRAAESDAQKDKAPKLSSKKSWFGGSWFGGKDKANEAGTPNAPVKVKLGEENSFYFDEQLKKWVNKKAGTSEAAAAPPPPPPPKGPSRSVSAAAAPPASSTPVPPVPPLPPGSGSATSAMRAVSGPTSSQFVDLNQPSRTVSPAVNSVPASAGTPPPTGLSSEPPSRPATAQSGSNNIDELIGIPQARKGGTVKKGKKGRGYVDVMAK